MKRILAHPYSVGSLLAATMETVIVFAFTSGPYAPSPITPGSALARWLVAVYLSLGLGATILSALGLAREKTKKYAAYSFTASVLAVIVCGARLAV
ncbi:MAG: hypothetical protein DMG22_20835 [Acidobacteria bacterium]|nr:MAG: hypothetical protein DMG22_20835 [Acidobacteriota bacterium]